jgi:mannosyltransferase
MAVVGRDQTGRDLERNFEVADSGKTELRWRAAAWVAGIVSASVMLARLDVQGLNGDEAFTAQMVKLPWSAMLSDLTRIDYNMSLHYIALKAWGGIFGFGEAALRLPSVIATLAALPILYRLASRMLGTHLASLSVILLALNPYFLTYALTARSYAFLILWSVVATLVLVNALADPTRPRWLLYGLIAVIGLHIHLTAIVIIASHGLFALFQQRRLTRLNGEAVAIIAVLGLIPTLLFLGPSNTLLWIGPFAPVDMAAAAYALGGAFPLGWAAVALAGAGIYFTLRSNRARWLPVFWLLVPVAVYAALIPVQSLFVDEYFAGTVAAASVLGAVGLARTLGRVRALAIPATLVVWTAALAVTLAMGSLDSAQRFRDLVPMMLGRVQTGDAVVFPNPYNRIVATYYSANPLDGPFPPGDPALPSDAWGTLTPYELDLMKRTRLMADYESFEPEILTRERVWVVGQDDEYDRAFLQDLVSHGYREIEVVAEGRSSARLYASG